MNIVGISGSKRKNSLTSYAVKFSLHIAEKAGAKTFLIDLADYDIPKFDPDKDITDKNTIELLKKIKEADGIILGSPEYHGTVSGLLKDFIDYLEIEHFENKPIGLLATSGGRLGGVNTINTMTYICRSMNTYHVPTTVSIPNADKALNDNGLFNDENVTKRINLMVNELIKFCNKAPLV